MIRAIFALILLAVPLAACGNSASAPYLEVTGLYIVDPAGGRDIASGYMKVTATGGDFHLVGVSSPDAVRVELHANDMTGNQMQMRQIESFDIRAGETLVFEHGGNHMMLFGWDEAMQPGDETELILTFMSPDDEEITLNLTAEIRDLSGQ